MSRSKLHTHYIDNDHPFDNMDGTLDIGDTDKQGKQHPQHEEYEKSLIHHQNTYTISEKNQGNTPF